MKRILTILISLTLLVSFLPAVSASNQYVQRQSDTIPEVELQQSEQLAETATVLKLEEEERIGSTSPQILNIFGWFEANDNKNTASTYAVIGNESQMILGQPGSGLSLQTLKIYTRNKGLNIKYNTRLDGSDWGEEAIGTYDLAQSSGNKEDIDVKMNNLVMYLTGPLSLNYTLYYRVYTTGNGWLPWTEATVPAVSDDIENANIEALEVRILPEGAAAPPDAINVVTVPILKGEAYTEGNGWMTPVLGRILKIGTEDQGLRLEAFRLSTHSPDLGITYQAFVEGIGWFDPTSDGNVIGTTDQGRRIEAVRIALTGEQAANYDLFYRAHVEQFGWLDWANNNQIAGTTNQNLRLEAIQLKILPKGSVVPGTSETPGLIAMDEAEGQILHSINLLRLERGLPLLTGDEKLHEAAVERSYELEESYSHVRPDLDQFPTILEDIEYRNDGLVPALGESIAATTDPNAAFASFSVKPGCLKLLLTDYFRHVGFASSVVDPETGAGNSVLFLVDTPSLSE